MSSKPGKVPEMKMPDWYRGTNYAIYNLRDCGVVAIGPLRAADRGVFHSRLAGQIYKTLAEADFQKVLKALNTEFRLVLRWLLDQQRGHPDVESIPRGGRMQAEVRGASGRAPAAAAGSTVEALDHTNPSSVENSELTLRQRTILTLIEKDPIYSAVDVLHGCYMGLAPHPEGERFQRSVKRLYAEVKFLKDKGYIEKPKSGQYRLRSGHTGFERVDLSAPDGKREDKGGKKRGTI